MRTAGEMTSFPQERCGGVATAHGDGEGLQARTRRRSSPWSPGFPSTGIGECGEGAVKAPTSFSPCGGNWRWQPLRARHSTLKAQGQGLTLPCRAAALFALPVTGNLPRLRRAQLVPGSRGAGVQPVWEGAAAETAQCVPTLSPGSGTQQTHRMDNGTGCLPHCPGGS